MSATSKVVLAAGALVVGTLLAIAIVGGLTAAHGPGTPAGRGALGSTSTSHSALPTTTSTTTKAEAAAHLLSLISLSPPDGATNQSLTTVVTVRANGARLVKVHVQAAPVGTSLPGRLVQAADEWRSTGGLLPGATYTVTYEVAGYGLHATGLATFRTSPPAETVTAGLFPSPGIVVGVGQPIVVSFSQPVGTYSAQQAVLSHLRIAMSKPVPGGWHWFSSVELHFRPDNYWPVGEQVRVSGDLDGWDVGGGAWGEGRYLDRVRRWRQPHFGRQPGHARDDRHRQRPGRVRVACQRRGTAMADDGRHPHRAGPGVRGPHGVLDSRHPGEISSRLRRVRVLGRPHF